MCPIFTTKYFRVSKKIILTNKIHPIPISSASISAFKFSHKNFMRITSHDWSQLLHQ